MLDAEWIQLRKIVEEFDDSGMDFWEEEKINTEDETSWKIFSKIQKHNLISEEQEYITYSPKERKIPAFFKN